MNPELENNNEDVTTPTPTPDEGTPPVVTPTPTPEPTPEPEPLLTENEKKLLDMLVDMIKVKVDNLDTLILLLNEMFVKLIVDITLDPLVYILEKEKDKIIQAVKDNISLQTEILDKLKEDKPEEPEEDVKPTYVLSKAWYTQDRARMSNFETEVSKFVRGEQLDLIMLMTFVKEYPAWSTEDKYYYLPILILMIRDYISSLHTQV